MRPPLPQGASLADDRPTVLLVGSLAAEGVPCGVTAAVDGLLASPLRERYRLLTFGTRNDDTRPRGMLRRLTRGLRLFAESVVRLRRDRVDLVDIHAVSGREFIKNGAVLLAARALGRPVVLRIHGGDFDRALDVGVPAGGHLLRALLRLADRVVVLSESWRERLAEIEPAAHVAVLPNSIDGEAFGVLASRRTAVAHDILLLGNLCERKGHFDALEAAARVLPAVPEASLVFAGAERDPGALEALRVRSRALGLEERVRFLGPVFGKEKEEAFVTACVLILPSHVENMPLSVMEGMASGLPVVATRVGATPEMIEDGDDGFLIEPRDVDALGDRLRLLLDDLELRRELGARGRAKALARWDRRAIADRTHALYAEVL